MQPVILQDLPDDYVSRKELIQIIKELVPVGSIMPYAGDTEPDGWFFTDGRALDKEDYPELYSVCKNYYTTTENNTTFNLPNTIDRFILSTNDNSQINERANGSAPQISANTGSAGGHTHTRGTMNITGTFDVTPYNYADPAVVAWGAFSTSQSGDNARSFGWASQFFNRWRTNFNAANTWSGETSSNGSHTHSITINSGIYTRTDSSIYSKYIKFRNIIKYEHKKYL